MESADFGTCLAGCGAVWALVLKIVLAPESKTEFWCLLFKPLVGFNGFFHVVSSADRVLSLRVLSWPTHVPLRASFSPSRALSSKVICSLFGVLGQQPYWGRNVTVLPTTWAP